jgi:hypothetical protein
MTIGYPRPPTENERRRAREQELKDAALKHEHDADEKHQRRGFFVRLFSRKKQADRKGSAGPRR